MDTNIRPLDLFETACREDNMTLVAQAILVASQKDNFEHFQRYSCRYAIKSNSSNGLMHLIKHGVDVQNLSPWVAAAGWPTSKAILEILLAHGWDINTRAARGARLDAQPFMWQVISDGGMVAWCLEHGASVYPKDQEPLCDDKVTMSQSCCQQILEKAASYGSIATFRLLRSYGAPLGWCPLHLAVEAAILCPKVMKEYGKEGPSYSELEWTYLVRMDMVRYLVDVVGLDVNAPDQPPGARRPDRDGTPLCYIPETGRFDRDTRELTWFLLDRGADPIPALKVAKRNGHSGFVEEVEEWLTQQWWGGRKCCVQ
jgi:hypothetical protein